MPNSECDVLVVGAGVIGLTTAICLAESGARVVIRAAAPPPETTSCVAGALWGLHLVEESPRVTRWGQQTLAVLRELAADPATGIRTVAGVEAARGVPPVEAARGARPVEAARGVPPVAGSGHGPVTEEPGRGPAGVRAMGSGGLPPGKAECSPGLAAPTGDAAPPYELAGLGAVPCGAADLPAGFASGWRYSAPLAHMPTYLGYLRARFEAGGGRLEAGTVRSLPAAAVKHGARAVLNCTGTGARDLLPDPALTPYRGQVVVAENPGLTEFFIGLPDGTHELMYLFPHGGTVVLGGTEVAGDWNTEPVPAVAERILRDCTAVEPRLRGARVVGHRVGLRPFRPQVRLEAEPPGDGPLVVHNYGHGGAGITLSWGCAAEAAALAAQALG